jgi:hypothetical protein
LEPAASCWPEGCADLHGVRSTQRRPPFIVGPRRHCPHPCQITKRGPRVVEHLISRSSIGSGPLPPRRISALLVDIQHKGLFTAPDPSSDYKKDSTAQSLIINIPISTAESVHSVVDQPLPTGQRHGREARRAHNWRSGLHWTLSGPAHSQEQLGI